MLALWKKSMTNLDSILKSRDIILPAKVCIIKAMVFPVIMYACESWAIKKAICMLSCFSCVQLFATLWTIAHQASLSRAFSTQEYWSGLPYPLAGALPNLGTESTILIHFLRLLYWQAGSLPEAPLGKPKEGWTPKNWCFWIVLLQKTLENPLDSKEIKAVNPKGNQPWIFIARIYADAEAPVLWPPNVKSWLWKRPWCCKRLKAGGERGNKGWDVCMLSLTQWTWVWANSGR